MKYIQDIHEGDRISDIYLCKQKQSAITKNGKPYEIVTLQDKTGVLDSKIWEPSSPGINDFSAMDYVFVTGRVISFQGNLQLNIERLRTAKPEEYQAEDYLPVSEKNIDQMYQEILDRIEKFKNPYLKQLSESFFKNDSFARAFKFHSAAKSVHHGFVGGLLEHTLNVTKMCEQYCELYPMLKRDLLVTAAIFHDVGKLKEISRFPLNDYTDEGQLIGHIVIGYQMLADRIAQIDGFPKQLEHELLHCILSHHGELEYGSPKKPALMEAFALSLADNTDAKLETLREAFRSLPKDNVQWQGYHRFLETNIRQTGEL